MDIATILNPPIAFRFWMVYYRFEDGRIMYFRGQKRNAFFVSNLICGIHGDWTPEENFARLFQFKPEVTRQSIGKKLFVAEILKKELPEKITAIDRICFTGFAGIVLATHLILPHG